MLTLSRIGNKYANVYDENDPRIIVGVIKPDHPLTPSNTISRGTLYLN